MTATREKDVVDLLVDQHNQVRKIFGELDTARGDRKRELFEDLVRLLAIHETSEEEVVHPVARRKIDKGEAIVDQRLKEENSAKHMLAELWDLGVDHPEFDAKMRKCRDEVLKHAEHEERDEFSNLRKSVDADQLRRMADALQAAAKMAPTRPHPKSPESALGNLIAGPPLAVFDRVRDTMREWAKKSDRKD
jgi:hemerythrin superfamily protein